MHLDHEAAGRLETSLVAVGQMATAEPATSAVRAWARRAGVPISDRGRLSADVWIAYREAHQLLPTPSE